jgi:hypothetical protein
MAGYGESANCMEAEMKIAHSDAEKREQLTRDFYVTMTFFKLPIDVRKVALESAKGARWRSAARCYRAIVNSLPIRNVP